ncbi:hypothetical protein QTV49_001714 [Vibrio vulnificus]|nr:hypothetical protein [Vibrio vulnificus]
MKSVDVFEDIDSLRSHGIFFIFVGSVMAFGVVFGSTFLYQAEEISKNIAFFAGFSVLLTLLSIVSFQLARSSIRDELESIYKIAAVMYFLTALGYSLSEFFIFFFGVKEFSSIPNWSALGCYVVISVWTLVKILNATKI